MEELEELMNEKNLLEDLDEIITGRKPSYIDFNQVVELTSPTPGKDLVLDSAAQDLLEQIQKEVELEKKSGIKFKSEDGLEERFEKLKELKTQGKGSAVGTAPKAPSISEFRDETDSWCCICNEDGTLVCQECDGDIYCNACFREGHKDIQFRRHIAKKIAQ